MNDLNSLPLPEDNQEDGQIEVIIAPPDLRIGAVLLNSLFTFIAFIPLILLPIVSILIFPPHSRTIGLSNQPNSLQTTFGYSAIILLAYLVPLIYCIWQIVMMSKYGQSLGKRLLKIKVIKSNGDEAGFVDTVLQRELFYSIASFIIIFFTTVLVETISNALIQKYIIMGSSLILAFFIYSLPNLICLIMLFNIKRDRRTLQDYVADTVVVKLPE